LNNLRLIILFISLSEVNRVKNILLNIFEHKHELISRRLSQILKRIVGLRSILLSYWTNSHIVWCVVFFILNTYYSTSIFSFWNLLKEKKLYNIDVIVHRQLQTINSTKNALIIDQYKFCNFGLRKLRKNGEKWKVINNE